MSSPRFAHALSKPQAYRRLAELLSGCVQRGKPPLSSALPGRPRTCQRLCKAIACIQISTAELMALNNRRRVVVLPIFTPNTLLERACFELNENVLVLKMKQGTVKCQGFKFGQSVGLAARIRERNVNFGGRWTSVIPSFHVWYSNSIPQDKMLPTMSRFWKSDQIRRRLVHFFRSNAELNSSFTGQLYRRRIVGQLTLV